MYFLFGYKHTQHIYVAAEPITVVMNRAIDFDIENQTGYVLRCAEDAAIQRLDVLNLETRSQKWYLLGVIGFLLNKITDLEPVTVGTAKRWSETNRITVLLDEAIPAPPSTRAIPELAKLILTKRLLAASEIHLVMLGTNTLALNFNRIAQSGEGSRDAPDVQLACVTHLGLPQYLPSPSHMMQLNAVFGDQPFVDVLPWLATLLASNLETDAEGMSQVKRLRQAGQKAMKSVREAKGDRLSDFSLYAMFQSGTHTRMTQSQILHGFACLDPWRQHVSPMRGTSQCTLQLHRHSNAILVDGSRENIRDVRTVFPPAHEDPIRLAVCVSNGDPFEGRSALQILQAIHGQAPCHDPTAFDALARDGNCLESHVGVAIVISSWGESKDILSNLALHIANVRDGRDVDTVMQEGRVKKSTTRRVCALLRNTFLNLLPLTLKHEEECKRLPAVLGSFRRSTNMDRRDAVACGRSCMSEECKNIKGGVKDLNKILKLLTTRFQRNAGARLILPPVVFLAVSALKLSAQSGSNESGSSSIQQALVECDGDWVVFHLPGPGHRWNCFEVRKQGGASETAVKPRVLFVVEVGLKTDPFNNMQTVEVGLKTDQFNKTQTVPEDSWAAQQFFASDGLDQFELYEKEGATELDDDR